MATTYIQFNPSLPHGSALRSAVFGLVSARQALMDCQTNMARMVDGDGSDAAQFTMVTNQFGTPDNATSKQLWDELNSAVGKINGDGTVDHVSAAILQLADKIR